MTKTLLLFGAWCGAFLPLHVFVLDHTPGAVSAPSHTTTSVPDDVQPPKLADLAFLGGAWGGSMRGGWVEEHWTAPRGRSMTGMLQWHRADGTPLVLELISIMEDAEALVMRLRHFSASFVPAEGPDDPVTLVLQEVDPALGRALFVAAPDERRVASIAYARTGDAELMITVRFPDAEPPRPALEFELKRLEAPR